VAQSDGDLEAAADYMLQALRYDPDNLELLFPAMHLAAATGRREDTVRLAGRILEVEPQHSLASLVLAVDAARNGDLEAAKARLAVLPGRGFDQVLLPMMNAWIQTGLGDVDGGLKTLSVLQGEGGTSVLYGVHAALIKEVAGRGDEAAQEYEDLLAKAQRPTLRITWLAGSFFERHGQRRRKSAIRGSVPTRYQEKRFCVSRIKMPMSQIQRRSALAPSVAGCIVIHNAAQPKPSKVKARMPWLALMPNRVKSGISHPASPTLKRSLK
jgi:hypothetical protein